jgi:hypothetical protein
MDAFTVFDRLSAVFDNARGIAMNIDVRIDTSATENWKNLFRELLR